ncbi:hypothetical protein M422DRAFT_243726, partial [Sphaerobolus stellatus SS14]
MSGALSSTQIVLTTISLFIRPVAQHCYRGGRRRDEPVLRSRRRCAVSAVWTSVSPLHKARACVHERVTYSAVLRETGEEEATYGAVEDVETTREDSGAIPERETSADTFLPGSILVETYKTPQLAPQLPIVFDLLSLSHSSTQLMKSMHFIGILAVATVSALAAPLDAVTPVNGVVAAAADVVANADAAVANIGVKGSDVADNIGNNNHVDVLPRDLVTVGALIEALANALAKADVSLKAVLANVDVQDSNLITNILNDNKITVLRRDGLVLPANIDAIVQALINAAVAAGADVQAAVANIGIDYSTLLSNIGNNNVIFVRSLPETVDIAALVKAIADACAKVGVDVNALIANINIENSSVLTDILNGNKVIAPVRRDGVLLPADIDAIVLALINAAVNAGADVQAAVANIGIDYSTLLSNIGNNNVVFVRSLPETVDIAAL